MASDHVSPVPFYRRVTASGATYQAVSFALNSIEAGLAAQLVSCRKLRHLC